MKLHTIALGCQMSAADAAEMARPIESRGFSKAETPEEADAILISTCTVRQHAEDRAISLIGSLRPWKEKNPKRILIVAGCAAQRLDGWIRGRFPHVDLVVGAKSIEDFPGIVEKVLGRRFDALAEDRRDFGRETLPLPKTPPPASAYLTIMRGCNYSCSYCIVPAVRGRELYRPPEDILAEAKELAASGVGEIMLLGQTVNSYRFGSGARATRFADLLRALDAVPGLKRLRFMSPHPHYVDERMISAMAQCLSVCEHLHLPAQSGSDRMLRIMRRNYTREEFLKKAAMARAAIGGLVISTDIIVGFPTETEEDFQATLGMLSELRPAWAYCFKYSPREGTSSAEQADGVPLEVKEDRLRRLNETMDRLSLEALRSQIGAEAEVLCEGPGFGRTRQGFKVKWAGGAGPGEMVKVRIKDAAPRLLLGEKR